MVYSELKSKIFMGEFKEYLKEIGKEGRLRRKLRYQFNADLLFGKKSFLNEKLFEKEVQRVLAESLEKKKKKKEERQKEKLLEKKTEVVECLGVSVVDGVKTVKFKEVNKKKDQNLKEKILNNSKK